MNFRNLALSLVLVSAVAVCTAPVQGAGIFWLSNSNVAGAPGQLDLSNQTAGGTGTMYLWGQTDVGVAGMGFNLLSSGSGLQFTGATYSADATNAAAWNLGNKPIVVTGPKVSDMTAATLAAAGGFGPGTSIGNTMLLASINYTLGPASSTSNLSLQVSDFGVADNAGNPLSFRFGDPSKPLLTGDQIDATGIAGAVSVAGGQTGVAPNIIEIVLNDRELSSGLISQQLDDGPADPAATWSNLVLNNGSPLIAPSLSNGGLFTWNPAGSKAGKKGNGVLYRWTATATNATGADTDFAITVRLIPEPATMSLLGLAMIGAMGVIRRRG